MAWCNRLERAANQAGSDIMHPFDIVREFEDAICEFTKAPYCVAVNSCTNALAICLEWLQRDKARGFSIPEAINIPKYTYVSVPIQIKRAGFNVDFRDEQWQGAYKLEPFNLWDSARRFEYNQWNYLDPYTIRKYICLSFHTSKILGFEQGGAILHSDPIFDEFARKMRFDGRTEGVPAKEDYIDVLGMHCYMSPTTAAGLLWKLNYFNHNLSPKIIPNDEYPDLSQMDIFK